MPVANHPNPAEVTHPTDCKPQFAPKVALWSSVWRIRWLVHLGDAVLWEKSGYCPGTMRCSVIFLITKVIPDMLPWKLLRVIAEVLRLSLYCAAFKCASKGNSGDLIPKCPLDLGGSTTSLDFSSLEVFLEALFRQSSDPQASIYRVTQEKRFTPSQGHDVPSETEILYPLQG